MAYEDGNAPKRNPLLDKLKYRTKLQGAIVTTLIILLNTWAFQGRALDSAELAILAGIWGAYNLAEGLADGLGGRI